MKYTTLFLMLLCSAFGADAQKFMTRSGKISFYSYTSVESIKANNNEVAAVLEQNNGNLAFIVPIKSFRFEKALMQEHFNENYMESDKYPKAEFKGSVADISKVNFSKDGSYNVTARGSMTIHGITKTVSIPGLIKIAGSKVTLTSKFTIRPRDYGIKIPSVVSSKIAEKIEVTVNCQLNK